LSSNWASFFAHITLMSFNSVIHFSRKFRLPFVKFFHYGNAPQDFWFTPSTVQMKILMCRQHVIYIVCKFYTFDTIVSLASFIVKNPTVSISELLFRQIFRIGTARYAEGMWRMCRHAPVIAHCTDLEDFPLFTHLTIPEFSPIHWIFLILGGWPSVTSWHFHALISSAKAEQILTKEECNSQIYGAPFCPSILRYVCPCARWYTRLLVDSVPNSKLPIFYTLTMSGVWYAQKVSNCNTYFA